MFSFLLHLFAFIHGLPCILESIIKPLWCYKGGCVSWAPRLSLWNVWTKWTREHAVRMELICRVAAFLCFSLNSCLPHLIPRDQQPEKFDQLRIKECKWKWYLKSGVPSPGRSHAAGGESQASEQSVLWLTAAPRCSHPLGPWKSCFPWNWSLVPKKLGTAILKYWGLS